MNRQSYSVSKVTALIYGVYAGLLGLEHGYYEVLQGNVVPGSLMIRAMGAPCQAATSSVGCEPALTVIPHFLITGILAILVSLLIITWAGEFV